MKPRFAAAAVLALLSCVAGAPAAPASLLERMRAAIIASQPFRADFVQQVFIDGELNLEESGFIVFADRTRVKWQYLNPERKTFILENGRYQYYDRESNQLLKGAIDPGNEQVIWDLLCSGDPGQDIRWEERTRTIRLGFQAGRERQELAIRVAPDFLPERVRQVSAQDVITVYAFRAYRTRIALDPGEFKLDLPEDVEIIENE
jgi:outer membrane lipoprotein-sorting protein